MAQGETSKNGSVSAEAFKASFDSTRLLIREKWPAVDANALEATHGDLEKVAELIASTAADASTLVKDHLTELHRAAMSAAPGKVERLEKVISQLEKRTDELSARLRQDIVPKVEEKVKTNIWASLAMALGLGVLLGFLFRSMTHRKSA